VNLMLTMLIGGLWHGAAWTFVIWGGLHGIYLVVHKVWIWGLGTRRPQGRAWSLFSWFLTMLAVSVAWVFFRAGDFAGAMNLLGTMATPLAEGTMAMSRFQDLLLGGWGAVAIAAAIAFLAPNTTELFIRYRPALFPYRFEIGAARIATILQWNPQKRWALTYALIFGVAFVAIFGWQSEFLYFQF
jgi:hypothetical protein